MVLVWQRRQGDRLKQVSLLDGWMMDCFALHCALLNLIIHFECILQALQTIDPQNQPQPQPQPQPCTPQTPPTTDRPHRRTGPHPPPPRPPARTGESLLDMQQVGCVDPPPCSCCSCCCSLSLSLACTIRPLAPSLEPCPNSTQNQQPTTVPPNTNNPSSAAASCRTAFQPPPSSHTWSNKGWMRPVAALGGSCR